MIKKAFGPVISVLYDKSGVCVTPYIICQICLYYILMLSALNQMELDFFYDNGNTKNEFTIRKFIINLFIFISYKYMPHIKPPNNNPEKAFVRDKW